MSSPRSKRSFVWEYFNKDSSSTVECRLCKKKLKYFGSTGSMLQHLKRLHPIQLEQDKPPSSPPRGVDKPQTEQSSTSKSANKVQMEQPSTSKNADVPVVVPSCKYFTNFLKSSY